MYMFLNPELPKPKVMFCSFHVASSSLVGLPTLASGSGSLHWNLGIKGKHWQTWDKMIEDDCVSPFELKPCLLLRCHKRYSSFSDTVTVPGDHTNLWGWRCFWWWWWWCCCCCCCCRRGCCCCCCWFFVTIYLKAGRTSLRGASRLFNLPPWCQFVSFRHGIQPWHRSPCWTSQPGRKLMVPQKQR